MGPQRGGFGRFDSFGLHVLDLAGSEDFDGDPAAVALGIEEVEQRNADGAVAR